MEARVLCRRFPRAHVYRKAGDGDPVALTATPVTGTSWIDTAPPAGPVCYRIAAVDALGREGLASEWACTGQPVAKPGVAPAPEATRPGLELFTGPAPFRPDSSIRFRLSESKPVYLAVYDARGRRVATLQNGVLGAGLHDVRWSVRGDDGRRPAAGVYFLLLRAGDAQEHRKLLIAQ